MGRLRNVLTLAVACALVLAALPAVAMAAEATTATSTAPLAAGPIDGQIWPAQDGNVTAVIVDISLDPKVKLPARVRIPVPKGAVVQWAGEILNGDASADQQRDFTLRNGAGGGSYAEFTLSVSHRGQIDTSGIAMTARGTQVSTEVDWIQSVPSTSTLFTVRVPAGASDVKIDPTPEGTPDTNSAGEKLYLLPVQALATGSSTTVKVTYNTSPTGASASPASNVTAVYIVLGVLLVGAVALVVYLFTKQRSAERRSGNLEDREHADDEDADESSASRTAGSGATRGSRDDDETNDDPFDIDVDDE
jgi:hypothetical protein